MSEAPQTTEIPASDSGRSPRMDGAGGAGGAHPIRRIAVLGAGTMGSRIAAHCANAGFPVLLLDLAVEGEPNRLASRAVESLRKSKPPALADPVLAFSITPGNFASHLPRLKDCDWIIEAVSEQMEIKRKLVAQIAPHLHDKAIFTTNTSGLPVRAIAEALPEELRRRWFGTHFFNPPRYMRLLELVPTPETDAGAIATISDFARLHLGKTVVVAKDSPNFIANRLGVFTWLNTLRVMQEMNLTIEEVDALTGSPLGWPKTGTFRLADLIGIDVLVEVAKNLPAPAGKDGVRLPSSLPPFLEAMIQANRLGDKSGQGFYRKVKGSDREERQTLDLQSLEYRPAEKPSLPSLEIIKRIPSAGERIRALLAADPRKDRAAAFHRAILPGLWSYAADSIGEISDNIADIDCAMRAGFNWELGPFEMWDAAGVKNTVEQMRADRQPISGAVETLLASGFSSWYRDAGSERLDLSAKRYLPVGREPGMEILRSAKRSGGAVLTTPDVSLIDVADGIAAIEFHSKMNTIGHETAEFVLRVLDPEGEFVSAFQGFIIANDGVAFSAGANLMQLLLAAQDEEWDEIGLYIQAFQKTTQAIRFCPRPVVSAPFGLALGGGAEISLHSALCQAHIELYMGLVETGVGLIPAGGGTKQMLLRALDAAAKADRSGNTAGVEVCDAIRGTFEAIAMARVSTSALDARNMGLLAEKDGITMNRGRLAEDAKTQALRLASAGYAAPLPADRIPAPGESVLATLKAGIHGLRDAERISDHDVLVAGRLAHVLCGGELAAGTPVNEQYLLDLEREAFLSLCGEPKTQARIAHTLKTGKPLRN